MQQALSLVRWGESSPTSALWENDHPNTLVASNNLACYLRRTRPVPRGAHAHGRHAGPDGPQAGPRPPPDPGVRSQPSQLPRRFRGMPRSAGTLETKAIPPLPAGSTRRRPPRHPGLPGEPDCDPAVSPGGPRGCGGTSLPRMLESARPDHGPSAFLDGDLSRPGSVSTSTSKRCGSDSGSVGQAR